MFYLSPFTSLTSLNEYIMNIFSDELKRFAHAIRVFGIFPLNFDLDYKISSFIWIWSIFIGLFSSIGFTLLSSDIFASFTGNLIRFRAFSYFIFSIIFSRNLPHLVQEINVFDQQFRQHEAVIRKPLVNRGSIWVLISAVTSLSIIAMHGHFMKSKSVKIVEVMVGSYTFNIRQLWIYLYIFFCFNLKSRLKDARKRWCQQIDTIIDHKYSSNQEQNLEAARLDYADLCRILENMSKCFGYHLGLYFITIIMEIINDIFESIYGRDKYFEKIPFILINFSVVFVLCWISGEVTREVRNTVIFIDK